MQGEATYASKNGGSFDRGSPLLKRIATGWRSVPGLSYGIGWRLLARVLFFSSVVTLVLTLIELYVDYRRDTGAIQLRMSEIDSGYRRSLGEGLWRLDARQLRLQVEAILRLPDITYVDLRESTDRSPSFVVTAGARQADPAVRREFRILYANHGVEQPIGILIVEATFDRIYRQLLNSAVVIMVGQGLKTFIVSFFILIIVHRLITRHLTAITTSLRRYDPRNSQVHLELERHPPRSADELDQLTGAFNQMGTRLRAAYGDLQEREARIRRLVDANIIGIYIIDLGGQIIEANDAFIAMLGYERVELVSGDLRWTDLTPLEWRAADAHRLEELKKVGRLEPFEKEYFRKDGTRVPVLVGVACFEDTGNQAVVYALDLTERKRVELEALENERRFREAQRGLEHASRVATMGQFSASIAHEVNQPVTAIIGNADAALRWLAHEPPNLEETRLLLGRISMDGRRTSNVVGRIKGLSKKTPPHLDRMEINSAIKEVIELTCGEAARNSISIQTELAEDLPLVEADRVQLQQVILNLMINAIQAMVEDAKGSCNLSISTSRNEADGVIVSVRDSGPGISQESLKRLFDSFYTTKADGMGLGLSICQSIVESHRGRIWVTVNEPRGATFHFTIPAAR